MFATYLWRIGQPRLLSAGPAAEHGAVADKQLAVIWMILVRPLLSKVGSGSLSTLMYRCLRSTLFISRATRLDTSGWLDVC